MSLDIKWEKLDGELARQLKDWINDRFRELDAQRPAFLGALSVTDLDFGSIPPTIAIQERTKLDITNVVDEFYLPDDIDIHSSIPSASNLAHLLAETTSDPLHRNFTPPTVAPIRNESRTTGGSSSIMVIPEIRIDSTKSTDSFNNYNHTMPTKSKNASVEDIVAQYAAAMRRETDVQIEILVDYKGDVRMSVSTELIINHPTPAFITLPMTLTLTGFSFTAVAVVSYLGDRVNFCFKENGDNRGLFNEISIESEIGDKGRQVLKNVGKIEKFVVDQIKTLVSDHFVYPNYHCLDLIRKNEEGGGGSGEAEEGTEIQSS
ncbi:Mitochondrial distribution and morphology protein 12 [Physocladia obscura]|uniref:Mitochondrial distribution and morphology protein 12 n=1 Tax=Physocladia obscura TaxID=109957 RepID=A0AAD5TA33_9FUNG|nr:Mitochondrial distribution and morphology protein 12 [Physocladia obscura]